MRIEHFRQQMRALGAKPCHEGRVLRAWAQLRSLDNRHRKAEDFLPLAMRHVLPELMAELEAM